MANHPYADRAMVLAALLNPTVSGYRLLEYASGCTRAYPRDREASPDLKEKFRGVRLQEYVRQQLQARCSFVTAALFLPTMHIGTINKIVMDYADVPHGAAALAAVRYAVEHLFALV